MKRSTVIKCVVSALVLVPTVVFASDFIKQDRCLDNGGVWFGTLGCIRSMPPIDRIVIDKSERQLRAYSKGAIVRRLPVSLGRDPEGPKQQEGDNRTPEGVYPLTEHKRDSGYHLALRVGYPTPGEAVVAQRQDREPGSDIMIHGLRNGFGWIGTVHRSVDWTRGCIALTNGEMEWLYRSTSAHTVVEITA